MVDEDYSRLIDGKESKSKTKMEINFGNMAEFDEEKSLKIQDCFDKFIGSLRDFG